MKLCQHLVHDMLTHSLEFHWQLFMFHASFKELIDDVDPFFLSLLSLDNS